MSEDQNKQPILDNEGLDLREEAAVYYDSHATAVDDQQHAEDYSHVLGIAKDSIDSALKVDETQSEGVQRAIGHVKETLNSKLQQTADYHVNDDINAVQESVDEAKVHYEANKEGYQQAALDDAKASGVETSFGNKQ